MKYFNIALALLFVSNIFAQSQNTSPTIQVTGKSEMSVMPDIGIVSMAISAKKMEFNDAISALDKKTAKVKKQLLKLNFNEDELKTRSFQIRKNTIYERNKRKDSGYVASQNIIVEFKNNKDRISEILSEFAEESVGMQLSFSFKLSDKLRFETQEKLMSMASKNAQKKAALLADNFGKKLSEIISISFGAPANPSTGPVRYAMAEKSMAAPISGFTPEEVKLFEQVHVIWAIK